MSECVVLDCDQSPNSVMVSPMKDEKHMEDNESGPMLELKFCQKHREVIELAHLWWDNPLEHSDEQ